MCGKDDTGVWQIVRVQVGDHAVEVPGDLNPMQRQTLDALAKPDGWAPLPESVVADVRARLHDGLAPLAESLNPADPLWVSKGRLSSVHGCEAHHLAADGTFAWTLANVRGTVLHKAVELGLNWRGRVVPGHVVDEAFVRLADDGSDVGRFVEGLSSSERATLRGVVVDLYTKFDECFPPLKAAWRPVVESRARYDLFDGRIVLSTRADLMLGGPGAKVIVDVKSGAIYANHREELRFYALVESLRSGVAPRLLASYSLLTARPEVEDVTEGVLQSAVRRTIDGVRAHLELTSGARPPEYRPGPSCRWCPLAANCEPGRAYLAGDLDDDA